MAKNKCLKTRKVDKGEKPYEVWKDDRMGFEYQVLKKYQADDDKPFARWLVRTKSPFTFGSWEYGDGYVADIKRGSRLVEVNAEA